MPDEVQNMIVGMREASLTLRKIGDIVETQINIFKGLEEIR